MSKENSNKSNYVQVSIYLEEGCSAQEDEYSVNLIGFFGSINLDRYGGVDDIELIRQCIENEAENLPIKEHVELLVTMHECWDSGRGNASKHYEICGVKVNE